MASVSVTSRTATEYRSSQMDDLASDPIHEAVVIATAVRDRDLADLREIDEDGGQVSRRREVFV